MKMIKACQFSLPKNEKVAKRNACPKMPMIMVHFQPNLTRTLPRSTMVTISATWPMVVTAMVIFSLRPTALLKNPSIKTK
jgi:hypothetical protein